MAKKAKQAKGAPITVQSAQHKVEYVLPDTLVPATYNPRTVTEAQLHAICRSIVEFGVVDPIIARREDGLILGGHQRLKGVARLLEGPFTYTKTVDGEPQEITVAFSLPDGKVPVIFLEGVDDARARVLNLALNRVAGEWEHDLLAKLLNEMSVDMGMGMDDMLVTGFTQAEIVDYLDIAVDTMALPPEEAATMPTQHAPESTDVEFVFAVPQADAAACRDVLKAFGMTGKANAFVAFVKAMKAAAATTVSPAATEVGDA